MIYIIYMYFIYIYIIHVKGNSAIPHVWHVMCKQQLHGTPWWLKRPLWGKELRAACHVLRGSATSSTTGTINWSDIQDKDLFVHNIYIYVNISHIYILYIYHISYIHIYIYFIYIFVIYISYISNICISYYYLYYII